MSNLELKKAEVVTLRSSGYPALRLEFNGGRLAYLVASQFDQLEVLKEKKVRLYDLDGDTNWEEELPPDACTHDPVVVRVAEQFIDLINQPRMLEEHVLYAS